MTFSRQSIFVAFLFGCLIGVLAGSRYQKMAYHRYWHSGPDSERALRRLSRDLDLDSEQRTKVKDILEKQRQKMLALHEQASVQLKEVRSSFRAQVRPLLKPDQQQKFQVMVERWDRRHAEE